MENKEKNPIVLSVRNLNVFFKTHGKDSHVIRNIDLDIKREECFAIVGESGSGKSVFTKTFTGMLESNGKVKEGKIILNDVPVADPKIVRSKFKDIHHFDRLVAKKEKKSSYKLTEASLAKEEKEYKKACKKIEKEIALNSVDGLQQIKTKKLNKEVAKKTEYNQLYFADHLSQAYNKVSNNLISHQKRQDRFMRAVNNIVDVKLFEDRDDHFERFSEIFKKLIEAPEILNLKEELAKCQKAASESNEFSKEQKDSYKKLLSVARKYSDKMTFAFNVALVSYKKFQNVSYPTNAEAEEELLEFVSLSLKPVWLSVGLAETEVSVSSIVDDSIAALVREYNSKPKTKGSLVTLVKNACSLRVKEIDEIIALIASKGIATLPEDYDFGENDLFADELRGLVNRNAEITKLRIAISNEGEAYPEKKVRYEQTILGIEFKLLSSAYKDALDELVVEVDNPSEDRENKFNEFVLKLTDLSEEFIYLPIDVKKDMLKIEVKRVRAKAGAADAELNKRVEERKKAIEAITVTDEQVQKCEALHKQIEELKKAHEQKVAQIKTEGVALDAKYKEINSKLLDDTVPSEMKEKYMLFDPADVKELVEAQHKLQVLEESRKVLVQEIENKRALALKLFAEGGKLNEVVEICINIEVPIKLHIDNLRKNENLLKETLRLIDIRFANEPNEERRKIISDEKEVALANASSRQEQIKESIRKAIVTFSVETNSKVSKVDTAIHNIRYHVSKLAILWRKIKGIFTLRQPMVKRLRSQGVITNNSINLAKLKTHREWSMIRGSHIATIFQDPMTSLNPLIKIGSQISDVLRLHHNLTKKEAKEEAISLLEKVHIPDARERYNDYPFQYSGGMRQRVVIAIALACRPDILICDEPTTALDVTVQAQILALIKELQQEYHFTIIFITHDLGVVAGVADRIGVMYGGQLIEIGTDEDIFYQPAHPYTWALLSSLPQLAVADEPLTYIRGNPPVFTKEIEGDSFAPRSEYAMRIDYMIEPPMFKISDTHYAKTWLLDKRAPKVKKPAIIRNLSERMEQTAKSFLATKKGE